MKPSKHHKEFQQELKSGLSPLQSFLARGCDRHRLSVPDVVGQVDRRNRCSKIQNSKSQQSNSTIQHRRLKHDFTAKSQKYRRDFQRNQTKSFQVGIHHTPRVIYHISDESTPLLPPIQSCPKMNARKSLADAVTDQIEIRRYGCSYDVPASRCHNLINLQTKADKMVKLPPISRHPASARHVNKEKVWMLGHKNIHDLQQEIRKPDQEQSPFYSDIIYLKNMVHPLVKAPVDPNTDKRHKFTNSYLAQRKATMDGVTGTRSLLHSKFPEYANLSDDMPINQHTWTYNSRESLQPVVEDAGINGEETDVGKRTTKKRRWRKPRLAVLTHSPLLWRVPEGATQPPNTPVAPTTTNDFPDSRPLDIQNESGADTNLTSS